MDYLEKLKAAEAKMEEAVKAMDENSVEGGDAEKFATAQKKFNDQKAIHDSTTALMNAKEEEKADEAEKEANARVADAFAKAGAGKDGEEAAVDAAKVEGLAFIEALTGKLPGDLDEATAGAVTEFKAALSSGTDADGGFTIPTLWRSELEKIMKAHGGVLSLCKRMTTANGNTFKYPVVDTTGMGAAKRAEGAKSATSKQPVFSMVDLNVHSIASDIVTVPNELMTDSIVDIRSIVIEGIGESFARQLSALLLSGSGSGEIEGIIPHLGNNQQLVSAASGKISHDDVIKLIYTVPAAYRNTASLVISDGAERELMLLKDSDGRPLWAPSTREGVPATIAGKPYIVDYSMDDVGANKVVMIFGNFQKLLVRNVSDGSMKADSTGETAKKNLTDFFAFQRWGAICLNKAAFATLKVKA